MEIKMMNNLKQKLGKSIENRRDELTAMADKIFDLSEVSGEEYQSAELICSYLEKEGFEVERGTGFVNHPFKVQADSQMIELQESMAGTGMLAILIEIKVIELYKKNIYGS